MGKGRAVWGGGGFPELQVDARHTIMFICDPSA